ncbi:GGT1-like protein [Mya arenaria]|uniref:GGT1-like protein n=1 Tax=Mya arenaria TaxID=6604 RepID=A0ABY7G3C2_MYAAR|nr:glutathione hydrolase 1 proenzyme-like [Mya arenaria]WAR27556.1 GGT1-like protein [Mya arenaria]
MLSDQSTKSKTSRSRVLTILGLFAIAGIVAIALGLGLGIKQEEKIVIEKCEPQPPAPCEPVACDPLPQTDSSRIQRGSPLYVQPGTNKEGRFKYASVAADTKICSIMGTEMMARHGGSAMDAAITATLCSGVSNPQSCGIGGGFFMTFYRRNDLARFSVMAREMAPGAATENMYKDTGASSREGGMAIATPGEVSGLYEAWKLGGKLPWSTLFQPVIQLCTQGFPVGSLLAYDIENNKAYIDTHVNLKAMLTHDDGVTLLKEGDTIKMPKLAATLEKIAADPFTFYNGSLAQDIVDDITEQGGIITLDDLKNYSSAIKPPLEMPLSGNFTALSPPPPSSGAVILLILNILNGYNMDQTDFQDTARAAHTLHRVTEAFKHGFSVRTQLGDVDQEDQQFNDDIEALLNNMTSASYGTQKREKITASTHETTYYEPVFDFTIPDAGTSHISVLGNNGDAVSITTTINLHFGSKVVGSKTGIVFNNEMDDFATPNTTNYFQVPASPANFIKPFKRPLSSMSPTIVLGSFDNEVKLVTGASGGTRIITSTALNIIETMWLQFGLKESIEYPRIHHQLLPPELRIEADMPQAIKDDLLARGHVFDTQDNLGSAVQALQKSVALGTPIQDLTSRIHDVILAYSDPVKYGEADGY